MWVEMNVSKLPKHLYHYTSLESLQLILQNNTLRFSRLNTVNDLNDAMSTSLKFANTAVFASCWSTDASESIPMWKMYADNMQGVRIKLPVNMFKGRENPHVWEKGGQFTNYFRSIKIDRE